MLNGNIQKEVLKRLRKIEGQVAGLERMVAEPRYCIDIINQITAVRRALDHVSLIIMKQHIETCVSAAIKKSQSSQKVNELIKTIDQFVR